MKTYFMLGVSIVAVSLFAQAPIAEAFSENHQHQSQHEHLPHHVVPYSVSANSSNTSAVATAGSTIVYDTTIPREYEIVPYPGTGTQVIRELIS